MHACVADLDVDCFGFYELLMKEGKVVEVRVLEI